MLSGDPSGLFTPVTEITGPWSTGGRSERRTFSRIAMIRMCGCRVLQCPPVLSSAEKKRLGTSFVQTQTPNYATGGYVLLLL